MIHQVGFVSGELQRGRSHRAFGFRRQDCVDYRESDARRGPHENGQSNTLMEYQF